jgi:hypothetical protein
MLGVSLYIAMISLSVIASVFFSKKFFVSPIKQRLIAVNKENKAIKGKLNAVESSLNWLAYDLLVNAKVNKLISNNDVVLVDRLINGFSELNRDKSKLKELIDVDGLCNRYKSEYPERWYSTLVKQILIRNVESAFDPAI